MSDLNVKPQSMSPGDMLRLQQQMQQRSGAYAQLAQGLLRGEIVGDNVARLHKLIGGSVEDLQHAQMEMALQRLLTMQRELPASIVRSFRP